MDIAAQTPLMEAARGGQLTVVKMLLDMGGNYTQDTLKLDTYHFDTYYVYIYNVFLHATLHVDRKCLLTKLAAA